MIIDIRPYIIQKINKDMMDALLKNRGLLFSELNDRLVRIKQGIGFR
jgi:hypothetical protein